MVTDVTIWNDNQQTDNYRLGFSFEDEKKPDKIVLSNRDDDRGYNNPHRWEFEIVDKKYIDDADTVLQTQITTNQQNIQNNANNIQINAQNIAANTTQLQDHESRITQNTNNIAQHTNDLNALNLRVGNNETEIANLKLFRQHPLSKVFNVIRGLDYYRLHSYVSYIQNGAVIVKVEVDFYTETGVNFSVELKDILPWIDVISTTPYNIENIPCCGHVIPLNQSPNVNDNYAITFDRDTNRTHAFVDSTLATINPNGSTSIDKMLLESNTSMTGNNSNGRYFITLAFTY